MPPKKWTAGQNATGHCTFASLCWVGYISKKSSGLLQFRTTQCTQSILSHHIALAYPNHFQGGSDFAVSRFDRKSSFIGDQIEQINRHSEMVGEGLPVGNGQLALQKLVILTFLLCLLFCEPQANPPTSGLVGLAAGRRLAVLLLLLLVLGCRVKDCNLPPVDLDQQCMNNRIKMSPSSGVVSIDMLTVLCLNQEWFNLASSRVYILRCVFCAKSAPKSW